MKLCVPFFPKKKKKKKNEYTCCLYMQNNVVKPSKLGKFLIFPTRIVIYLSINISFKLIPLMEDKCMPGEKI